MFLKTANDKVDRHDVARYLEQQGILNDDSDRITSSDDYKGIVKTALNNKPTLLGGAKKKRNRTSKNAPDTTSGKALTYLDKIIRPRISVQKHDTRINEDDIIKPLKDNGIIKKLRTSAIKWYQNLFSMMAIQKVMEVFTSVVIFLTTQLLFVVRLYL